jgi:hypothetical protein
MCGNSPFFEVTPLASDALLTTLHPLLENVLQIVCRKVQEELRSSLFIVGKAQKSRGARSGLYGRNGSGSGSVEPHYNICHTVQISPHAISGLFQHEKGAPRKEFSK